MTFSWFAAPLDELLRPLAKGRCYTVLAPTGCGKTLFGLNLVAHLVEHGHDVLVVPTEESSRYLELLACRASGLSYADYFYRRLTDDEEHEIKRHVEQYAKHRSLRLLTAPEPTIDQIFQAMEERIPDVLVIDYLQCLNRQGRNLSEFLDWAWQLLTEAADRLQIVAVILAQVHRPQGADLLYNYRIPTLHSGQGSSRIEQKSDVVLALSRVLKDGISQDVIARLSRRVLQPNESMRDYEEPNTLRVTCLKHRMDDSAARRSILLTVHRGKLDGRLPNNAKPDWLSDDDEVPF